MPLTKPGRTTITKQAKPEGPELVRLIAHILDRGKAEDLLALDLRGMAAMSDFFLIAGGQTDNHVRALVKQLDRELKQRGVAPVHREGEQNYNWVLLDFFDVIVHLFRRPVREYYDLERLWGDAPELELELPDEPASTSSTG